MLHSQIHSAAMCKSSICFERAVRLSEKLTRENAFATEGMSASDTASSAEPGIATQKVRDNKLNPRSCQ